ncbi:MAG: hypothetical protein KDB01_10835, partial [Planctomycetaceae bacterium]|nr:hypothetical protein [Planctomycetaceae bacterium]
MQITIGLKIIAVCLSCLVAIGLIRSVLKVLSWLVQALRANRSHQRTAKGSQRCSVPTVAMATTSVVVGMLIVMVFGSAMVHSKPQLATEEERIIEPLKAAPLGQPHPEENGFYDPPPPMVPTALPTAADQNVQSAEEKAAFVESRKADMQQLVIQIGQFVRASLELVSTSQGANAFGQAAESANGDVVVFQPSDEMVNQILGVTGRDLLRSFNSELPRRIRQTYALIPLSPPMRSTVPVDPLLAAGGLEKIANSIGMLVERAESSTGTSEPASTAPVDAARIQLAEQPESRPMPEWVKGTDGRRIVTHTKPILPGDDADALLLTAVNEALKQHVESVTASISADLHRESRLVRMELPGPTARKFIVDTYERLETVETPTAGAQPFRVLYALLEFPEV